MTLKQDLMSSRTVIGIALSDTTLTVPTVGSVPLAPRTPGSSRWEALHVALTELAERGVPRDARLAVALLPPLIAFRSVVLPKMRDADLRAILSRSGGRYFPAVREPHTVVGTRVESTPTGETRYAIATAPSALLDAIQDAADAAGMTIDRFVPAYSAWASAASAHHSRVQRAANRVVVIRPDGGSDVLRIAKGIPVELRRHRAGVNGEDMHGAIVIDRPVESAARYAMRTHVLELLTPELRTRRQGRRRQIRGAIAAGVVMLVIGAAGVVWGRTRSELHRVAQERTQLESQVAAARQAQGALSVVTAPAHALAGVEEKGVTWSAALAELSDNLPPDAYVESVRASGDTLIIDGAAQNGARVFQTVATSALLAASAPVGPIRREAPANDPESVVERFTLMARIPNAVLPVPSTRKRPK